MNSILSLIVFLLAFNAIASDFTSDNKKGFWITPDALSQNQMLLKNGDDFVFNGSICVVRWGGALKGNGNGNGNKEDKNNKSNQCLKVPSSKLVFKAYFPDSLHDVSDKLIITQSNDKKSWNYSLKTEKLKNTDLNQFTLTIGTDNKKSSQLLAIKAKLEKRILILQGFKSEYIGNDLYKENLAFINNMISYLQGLVGKINSALDSNPDIIAQLRQPLQVDNIVSAPFYYSSNFSGYKLNLNVPIGIAFQGEKSNPEVSMTNISDRSFYFPETEDDQNDDGIDEGAMPDGKLVYRLSLVIDGKSLIATDPFDLGYGETKTIAVQTASLSPSAANKLKVTLERSSSGKFDSFTAFNRTLGTLYYDLPVIEDNVSPAFSNLKPLADSYLNTNPKFEATLADSWGRVNPQSLKVLMNGQDVTNSFTPATANLGTSYVFTGNFPNLIEGDYILNYSGKDFAGNSASAVLKTIHYDKTPPKIYLFNTDNSLTNNPAYKISLTVADVSPITTRILQNGKEVFSSADYAIDYDATLVEGINTFEIQSVDAAGNVAEKKILSNITLDTIPPSLSNILPENDSNIYNLKFNLTGTSNEPLLNIKVNGKDYSVGGDYKSFSIPMTAFLEGDFPVDVVATDLAQNSISIHLNYHIVLKVLNSDLIAITPNPDNADKLYVSGAAGAARPGSTVKLYAGFFNQQTLTANADGSFQTTLDYFDSINISATDTTLNKTESATLKYNVDTTLAGVVKDTEDKPLSGATVTILGSGQQTVTDQTGSFRIPKPATGDQVLSIDGTTIPLEITGGTRKFFKVNIAVSIGTRQLNILDRTIHLAPLLFDGTETTIADANSSVVVESSHAQGVSLEIPAGVATFPDTKKSGIINVSEISSDYTSVAPFDFAKPNTVYAFEPSGLTFSTPVKLTLPNVNEIPAGVQMVIMSKNSQKGIWEIDGLARVSDDGSEIVTEDGGGITHFSEVYASPIGPRVSEYGGTGHVGADIFNGSLQNSIDLPSYKMMGKDVAPNLSYHSNWANPYVVVSNVIDVPRNEYSFNTSAGVRNLFAKASVNLSGKAWIEPDFIDAQFYTDTITMPQVRFTGLPQKAVASYALDLSSLSSGIKPYYSHYDLHLKQMVVGTKTTYVKKLWGATRTYQESFSETRAIAEVFPQDLPGVIHLQNYHSSKAGQGWRINGAGKIYDLDSPRILLEESNGATSSYALKNNIETIYYDSSRALSAAGLNSYPNISFFDSNSKTLSNYNTSTKAIMNQKVISDFTAKFEEISGYMAPDSNSCDLMCGHSAAQVNIPVGINSLLSSESKLFIFSKQGTIHNLENGILSKISGQYKLPTATATSSFVTFTDCPSIFGFNNCNFLSQSFSSYGGISCTPPNGSDSTFIGTFSDFYVQACIKILGAPVAQGEYPVQGSSDGNNPSFNSLTSAINGIGNEIILADFGNNLVRALDIVNNKSRTIAGNGQTYDNGDGKIATQASMYHPTGLAKDSNGNVYISTENGFIRKLDPNGYMSTFAGKTNGTYADVTQAQDMRLSKPSGMVVDVSNNYLYVADTGHHRVVKIDLATRVATTVAGSGSCQSSNIGDGGSAITSSLCSPTTLGLDDNKNLLIFDQGHNRIRRVLLNNSTNGVLAYESLAKDNSSLSRLADGTFVRTYRNGSTTKYDNLGREAYSQDRLGNTFSFQYNSDGSLASITDPTNRSTQYQYSGDKLERITDPQGRNTDFYYDDNNLSEVRFPDGSARSFEYDSNGLMTSEIDKRGSKTIYSYNIWHRLQSVTLADNSTSIIQDATSATIGNNFVSGQVGSLKSISNNEVVDGIKDSKGQTTTLNKDENGFVSTITDAKGQVYSIERDIDGRPTKMTRPDQTYSAFTYDTTYHDLISKYDSATDVTINFQYDDHGNLLNQTMPNGENVVYDYDDNTGVLLSKTLPLGVVETYDYYSNGLLKTKTNSLGQKNSFVYGTHGNIVTVTDNANQSIQVVRDLAGNILTNTNTKGQKSEYVYDNFNRLISVKSPSGELTSYDYLTSGELSKITDPENNQTIYEYNSLGRLTQKTDPLGMKTQLAYDLNGNVTQEIDPVGNVKTNTYDQMDRLIKKVLPDNVYEFTYDIRGNLETVKNNNSQIQYAYLHREGGDLVTRETTPDNVLDYNYDISGNRIEMATSEGSFYYTYDKLNRLTKVTNNKGEVFDFTYDVGSRLTKQRSPASVTNYAYDSVNFLTQINHQKRSTLTTLAQFDYVRDSIGNITKMTSIKGDFNYVYDNNNQLINATHPENSVSTFTYDPLGNRITDQYGNYNYDNKKQRLLEDWKYQYAYDNNGNISSKILKTDNSRVTHFIHNSENQLVSIREYNGANIVKETKYTYDVAGRRIKKASVDNTDSSKSFTRKFLYDNQEILFELDESSNLISTFTHSSLRTDDVLAIDKSGTSYFYLKDHLGTINDIINASGDLVQHYVYSPFGKIIRIENASGADITSTPMVDNFYTFTGREYDKESGLYYYRARYLDSDTGRFIQSDPHPGVTSNPLTFNSKYSYVLNDPVNSADPTGQFKISLGHTFSEITAAIISLGAGPIEFAALMFARNNLSDKANRLINYAIIAAVTAAFSWEYAGEGIFLDHATTETAITSAASSAFQDGNFFVNFSKSFSSSAFISGVSGYLRQSWTTEESIKEAQAFHESSRCTMHYGDTCMVNPKYVAPMTRVDVIKDVTFNTKLGEYILKGLGILLIH